MEDTNQKVPEKTYQALQDIGPYIHVDYIASRIAFLYEKVRQAIDYQEEHLLRENAIERILRRRLFFTKPKDPFALELIEELIRGGYFPNDSIPETKIGGVQTILDKYITTLKGFQETKRYTGDLGSFVYGVAACEIEEFLDPPTQELILMEFEYETLRSKLRMLGSEIPDEEKDLLLFTVINQTLLRADARRMYFRLMQKMYPQWFARDNSVPGEFLSLIEEAKVRVDGILNHTALKRLRNIVRQFAIVFHTISDITDNDASKLIALAGNRALLEQEVQIAYTKRFQALKVKLRRASFRSVVSIFSSKVLIALALEIPVEVLIVKHVVLYPFFVSVLFPPFLMFLIVSSIRLPARSNLENLILQVAGIIDGTFAFEAIELRARKKRSFVAFMLRTLQLVLLGISLGILIFVLNLLHFSILSMAVFVIFLSLIIFSGTRVKQWSYELTVGAKKEGMGGFMIDVLSLPIVSFGKLLAGELSRFNMVILLLNLFFEAPLQSFIQFVEEWRRFIKEKKEEL